MAKKRDKQETPVEPEEVVVDLEQDEDDEAEIDEAEIDPDLDEEDLADPELDDDDEFVEIDGEFADGEDESEEDAGGPVRRSVTSEDEDEDDELLAPDDVEADLDTILKDRMVAADEDDEEDEPEDRTEAADRLQPKRADEQLCPSCFLLVRQGAPVCPVGDDECPLVK